MAICMQSVGKLASLLFFYLRFNLITPNHLCEVDIIILIFLYELYILVPYGRQIYGISYRQLLQYSYIQYIFVRWKCFSNTFIDIVHETKYTLTVLMATRGGIWRFHYLWVMMNENWIIDAIFSRQVCLQVYPFFVEVKCLLPWGDCLTFSHQ